VSPDQKFERLQETLLSAPDYFMIADGQRAACKRFLALAGAATPNPAEIEEAYAAAVVEARSLVGEGKLTGVDPSDLDLSVAADRAEAIGPVENAALRSRQPAGTQEVAEAATAVPTVEFSEGSGSTTGRVDDAGDQLAEVPIHEVPIHEVANIFPMMSEADLTNLADDIKEHGLREPIWLHEGTIIDGRNRYRACRLAGVEPAFRDWDGSGSLVMFVLSLNLHRRHLTDQQRALVAAKAKEGFEAEALARRSANLIQNKGATERLDPTFRSEGSSANRAAAMLDVSVDATKKASRILKTATPDLVAAVEQGTVSLDAASAVSKLPAHEQEKVVRSGKVKEKASELRASKAKVTKDGSTETIARPDDDNEERPVAKAPPGVQSEEASTHDGSSTEAPSPPHDNAEAGHAADTGNGPVADPKPAQVTASDALGVLLKLIRAKGPTLARNVIDRIAAEAGLSPWLASGQVGDDLSTLDRLVVDHLEVLAGVDLDDARAWVEGHNEALCGVLLAAAPEDDNEEAEVNDDLE